jgi:HTH-type transcriptional regulator/antitoxin HigA
MDKPFKPAQVFHPGEYLKDELAERGWSRQDFARIINIPLQTVDRIICGKQQVTAEIAKAIGLALGTGPEVWLNLQGAYDLFHAPEPDPEIVRRVNKLAHVA